MKRSLYLIATVILLATSVVAQQYPIVVLRATGSRFYEEADILSYSGLTVDKTKEVALEQVKEAAEKVANSGVFKTVGYQHSKVPGGMKVELQVTDNDEDQFLPANFENIVWLSPEQLAEEIHGRVPLFRTHVSLSGTITDDVAKAISAILAERNVKSHVSANPYTKVAGTPDEMQFTIDDRTIVIGKVEIVGASSKFSAPLQETARKLDGLTYSRTTIRNFADTNLRKVLLTKGHLKASFGDPGHSLIADDGAEIKVKVTIPVKEGNSYKLAGATWTGNRLMQQPELERYVHFFPGLTVNGDLLEYEVRKLREAYSRRGYMQMTLDARPTFDDAAGLVRYAMAINEGQQFRMGDLEVSGLSKQDTESLLNAWKLRPGDPFDVTYAVRFLGEVNLPSGAQFSIEQSEGEAPQTVDITFVLCKQKEHCGQSATALHTPEGEKSSPRR
jgi:outer membrane protein assembly factor BamA